MLGIIFGAMVVMLILTVPIGVMLLVVSLIPSLISPGFSASIPFVLRNVVGGLNSTPLLAIPLFILGGIIMAQSGIAEKLFDVFAYLIGNKTGGMPCASIITCLFYGAISGYCGGKVDAVMQRIVELIYAVPEMLVVLLIATALKPILTDYVNSSGTSPLKSFVNVLGPNLISMFIAFGLLYWVTMSRIIRGQVLQLKQQEYVTAARALGASGGRIIRRHLLPNCIGQIVVTTCLQIPSAIFLESFLSYLGVGVSAPLPSLGSMATDALSGMYTYTYRLIVPSVILSIMILAFNLFGDGLRDALDPKLKK